MNDNEPLGDYGIPVWACEIVNKHDLGLRSESPLAAATVLLTDAAYDVREIAATAYREQALTPSTKQRLREVIGDRHAHRRRAYVGDLRGRAKLWRCDGSAGWHSDMGARIPMIAIQHFQRRAKAPRLSYRN